MSIWNMHRSSPGRRGARPQSLALTLTLVSAGGLCASTQACSDSDSRAETPLQTPAGAGPGTPLAGASADAGTLSGPGPASAGSPAPPTAGAAAIGGSTALSPGAAGSAGVVAPGPAVGGAGGSGGSLGTPSHQPCADGELADARDTTLTGMPDYWTSPMNGAIDLVLPAPVLAWMGERVWEQSHDAWHNVRRCRGGGPGAGGGNSLCSRAELVADHQECVDAEDGYQFLVFHRHMMLALQQAFPAHASLFDGFPTFPFDAKDVPAEWQDRWGNGWSDSIQQTAMTLEDIEANLDQFATEGDLGRFIQCGGMGNGASSIHGALHFKWVVNDSPHSLGKQTVNIDNYMFWKLHGWIDHIWERYRIAKGLLPAEPKLQEALIAQCTEMHDLGHAVDPSAPTSMDPLPVEHGVFHESVRPILEKTCASCHSEASPEAGLSLGGHISSADVVKGLVNQTAMHGGQFMRVLPGSPDQSWLYLKVSGTAMNAGCNAATCNAQVMPPTGQVTLSTSERDAIRQWIASGAPAPTP